MKRIFWITMLLTLAACLPPDAGVVRGTVVDNETKSPIADVQGSVPSAGKTVKTGFDGQF